MIRGKIISMMALAALLSACTFVSLDGSEDMPESVSVNFTLDWPGGVSEEDKPERMCVAMSRIINTVHYVWQVDAAGNLLDDGVSDSGQGDGSQGGDVTDQGDGAEDNGSAGNGEDYSVTEENTGTGEVGAEGDAGPEEDTGAGNGGNTGENGTEEAPAPAGREMLNGEYYMMIFNDVSDTYGIEPIESFGSDPSVSMRDLYATVRELSEEELPDDVADFNPAFGYISGSDPLYIDVKKQRIYPTVTPVIDFDLKQLTQTLTFRVRIELEEGVSIDGETVRAEVSGVARRVQLMSATISDSTYRVLFDMRKVGSSGNVGTYEGKVNVLGLFPAGRQEDIVGPGILQLSINATSGDNHRRFHAGINLRETIVSAGLIRELNDRSGYRAARSSAVLNVDTVLHIDENQILPDEDSQGVEIWFENDGGGIFDDPDDDLDIEV